MEATWTRVNRIDLYGCGQVAFSSSQSVKSHLVCLCCEKMKPANFHHSPFHFYFETLLAFTSLLLAFLRRMQKEMLLNGTAFLNVGGDSEAQQSS
ncbi:hypothetical protein TSMEX_002578 [Taenia solium]|eukprot:TsM_000222800 transcript=TsM_000222800 gene=TsM_000222800